MTDKEINSYEEYQKKILDLFYKDLKTTELVKAFLQNNIHQTKVELNPYQEFLIFEDKKIDDLHRSIKKSIKYGKILNKKLLDLQKINSSRKEDNFNEIFKSFSIFLVIIITGLSLYYSSWDYIFLIIFIMPMAGILSAIFKQKTDYHIKKTEIISSREFKYIKNLLLNRVNYNTAHDAVFKFNDINLLLINNNKKEGKYLSEKKLTKWTENELKSYFYIYAGNFIRQLNDFKKRDAKAIELFDKIDGGSRKEDIVNIRGQLLLLTCVYGAVHKHFLNIEENKRINEELLLMKKSPETFQLQGNTLISKFTKILKNDEIEMKYFSQQLLSISNDIKLNNLIKKSFINHNT